MLTPFSAIHVLVWALYTLLLLLLRTFWGQDGLVLQEASHLSWLPALKIAALVAHCSS